MSKEKMQQARALIEAKRYPEARAILKTVDHPKAREWLAKLDAIAPPSRSTQTKSKSRRSPVLPILVGILVLSVLGGAAFVLLQNDDDEGDETTESLNFATDVTFQPLLLSPSPAASLTASPEPPGVPPTDPTNLLVPTQSPTNTLAVETPTNTPTSTPTLAPTTVAVAQTIAGLTLLPLNPVSAAQLQRLTAPALDNIIGPNTRPQNIPIFSKDGRLVAALTFDEQDENATLFVRDAATGQAILTIPKETFGTIYPNVRVYEFTPLAFSTDGTQLYVEVQTISSSQRHYFISVFDVASGQAIGTPVEFDNTVPRLVNPDHQLAVSTYYTDDFSPDEVTLTDLQTKSHVTLDCHNYNPYYEDIGGVNLTDDGKYLIFSCFDAGSDDDGEGYVINLETQSLEHTLAIYRRFMTLSGDGRVVAAIGLNGLLLFDTTTWQPRPEVPLKTPFNQEVRSISLNSDGSVMVGMVGDDLLPMLFDTATGTVIEVALPQDATYARFVGDVLLLGFADGVQAWGVPASTN